MYVLKSIVLALLLLNCCSKEETSPEQANSEESFELTEADLTRSNYCGEAEFTPPEDPLAHNGYDVKKVEQQLMSLGIEGYIHGAVAQYSYYVINYGPTLKSVQFNLISFEPEINTQLRELKRHDKVNIKGFFLENKSPVKHIVVTNLEIIAPYEHRDEYDYSYDDEILAEFSQNESKKILAKVHAVINDGQALIIDYKDAIIPVFIETDLYHLTKDLYRNDKILINAKPLVKSRGPLHLSLDKQDDSPIKVIDKMVNCHGKQVTLEGILTMFYKSPQINLNVFAIKHKDPNGLERNFTFFPDYNTDNEIDQFMELFGEIQNKLNPVWDAETEGRQQGRNSMYNPKIKVKVSGKINVVSKSQANPQIYIKEISAIEVRSN